MLGYLEKGIQKSLGTAAHFWKLVVLKSRSVPIAKQVDGIEPCNHTPPLPK